MKIADGANQIKIASLFLRSGLDCSHCGDFDLQRKGAEREDMPMGIAQHPGYVDHLQAVIGLGTRPPPDHWTTPQYDPSEAQTAQKLRVCIGSICGIYGIHILHFIEQTPAQCMVYYRTDSYQGSVQSDEATSSAMNNKLSITTQDVHNQGYRVCALFYQ
jgi:hypothetical protein